MRDIFDYTDYKAFLRDRLAELRSGGRGTQGRLAQAMNCQPAYLSMVLSGNGNLSLEQADRAAKFLGLATLEGDYLLALVQRERAGTASLQRRFSAELDRLRGERQNLSHRLTNLETLPDDVKAIFYSTWYYPAIHLMLTIPSKRTPTAMASYLRLPVETVAQVLEFLTRHGLAQASADGLIVGPSRLHLGTDSPFLAQSQKNWRQMSWQSLQRPRPDDFHYSSLISGSRRDLPIMREVMIQAIAELRKIIRTSQEEDLFCYNLDLFCLEQ